MARVAKGREENGAEVGNPTVRYRRQHHRQRNKPDADVLDRLEQLGLFENSVLRAGLVLLDPEERRDLLGVAEPFRLHGGVREKHEDHEPDHDRHDPNDEEENAPACKFARRKRCPVGDGAAEDLRQAVAHVEPRDPPT